MCHRHGCCQYCGQSAGKLPARTTLNSRHHVFPCVHLATSLHAASQAFFNQICFKGDELQMSPMSNMHANGCGVTGRLTAATVWV